VSQNDITIEFLRCHDVLELGLLVFLEKPLSTDVIQRKENRWINKTIHHTG